LDVFRLGRFRGLGRFIFRTFSGVDVLRHGRFVFGLSVVGRFVFGRLVGVP
jgi:hypothetical protein